MAAPTPKGILKTEERVHKKNIKKARLIIRNLSFKVSESQLKDVFGKFGNVVEVNIPVKSDGKKRGFAFVQFDNTKNAIRAINGLNSKNILNRPVAVDFAVCKSLYEANNNKSDLEVVDSSFKAEDGKSHLKDSDDDDVPVAQEKKDSGYDSDKMHSDSEEESSDDEQSSEGEPAESGDDSKSKDSSSSDEENASNSNNEKAAPRKHFKKNDDAKDGLTLFLRNLSFQTEEEDLEELMEEFGEVDYAVLCHDPVTDLPKGTGFVRFTNKESAQTCMDKADDSLQGGIMLDGRRLGVSLALSREEAHKMSTKEPKEGKDNRNLYLSREGLIRQGTQAAEGVSKADVALRSRLEYRKRNALRNLHFFVSRTRLCIHNIPPSYNNNRLKNLFLKGADDTSARITEARIMKDQKGQGKSKGFAFVEFTEHQHALAALRTLNNNPDVFTHQKRPIVEFSIENRNAINAKLKRQEKSKAQNAENKQPGVKKNKAKMSPSKSDTVTEQPDGGETFSGFKSKRDIKNMPSHLGPKVRHKKSKPEKKVTKETPGKKKQGTKPSTVTEESPRKSKKKGRRKGKKQARDAQEEKAFQTLVNKYKGNLSAISETQRSKWYEAD